MNLSKNFTLEELTKSSVGENIPTKEVINNLQQVVTHILQPTRDHFGPVKVNSGYRSPTVNKAVGGATNSQHMTGNAVDFEVPGIPNATVAQWIVDNCPYDQVILEFYTGGNTGWVHASWAPKRRCKLLIANKDGKKTVYREVRRF
ncbi:DUF882 domain-containing protein [bacterium]|nr:DUF882 domain-containing protein [bacterium]